MSKCHKNKFETHIVTNGRKFANRQFTNEISKFKNSTYVTFSIEGTKLIHNETTGAKSYCETIAGIKNCLLEGVNVAVNTTLSPKNIDLIGETYDQLIGIGVRSFAMNIAVPPVNSSFCKTEYLNLCAVNKGLHAAAEYIDKYNINFIFTTPMPFCAFDRKTLELIKHKKIQVNNMCHIFNGAGVVFDVTGDMVLCTHVPEVVLGSNQDIISRKRFEKFWDSEIENSVRKKLRIYPSKKCNICDMRNSCTGGCPILWQFSFFHNELFKS